jgi:anti-anti-sigma factor
VTPGSVRQVPKQEAHGGAPRNSPSERGGADISGTEHQPLTLDVELSLHGDLNASSARELEAQLFRWVASSGTRETVINLQGLDSIDSTGLAVLLRIQQYASQLRHNLRLRRPTGEVERTIALIGLEEVFAFID